MAVWELIVEAMTRAHERGTEWLSLGEVANEALRLAPDTNRGSITADTKFHCINDPSAKHSPGHRYLRNPQLITDDPAMHGKRYRRLSDDERRSFLSRPRGDLDRFSYTQTLDWLGNSEAALTLGLDAPEPALGDEGDGVVAGVALLELHLQDYLHRNWRGTFPGLNLVASGREYVTSDPSVGVLDFLCTDADGNYVIIETKRDMPDRQAIGQILGYMGWVKTKLCRDGQQVRGMLIAGEATDRLRMAVAAVPSLELHVYEIAFHLRRDAGSSELPRPA